MSSIRSGFRKAAVMALALVSMGAAPALAQFTSTGPMNRARDLQTATLLPDGTVLIAGGEDEKNVFGGWNDAEIFDPATGTFTFTANTMSSDRVEPTATLLANGKVLVAGGWYLACCRYPSGYGDEAVATADVYDPATHLFTQTASLATPRYEHSALRLADGRVLIVGGFTGTASSYPGTPLSSAEIYDPVAGTFSSAGDMTTTRIKPAMFLLPSGKVLIAGGAPGGTPSAELYDPVAGTFTATTGTPVYNEEDAGAYALPDGRVLLIGGGVIGATGVETYDPATDSFTSVGTLLADHQYWSVKAQLADGRIFIAGHSSAEVYDPATNTSTLVGNPGVGDLFPAGAALQDGRVLVTGGETFVPYAFVATNAASIYSPNAPPTANAGGNQTVSAGSNCSANVTLDGSASSDPDGNTLTYSWMEGTTVLGTDATIDVPLGLGAHTVTLTVDDGHGGTNSATVTITVVDTTAPSFTVPPAVVLEQAGPGGTVYSPAIPAALDNCDPNPVVSVSGVPAGSLFPAGQTTLTYTAADSAGNRVSAQSTVTVRDTIAPSIQITAPTNTTYGLMQAVDASYSCTDGGSGIASCTGTVPSGSAIDTGLPGSETFSVTATDLAGNSTTVTVPYAVVGLPGRMAGAGSTFQNGDRSRFEFLAANDGDTDRDDGGRLRFWMDEARGRFSEHHADERGHDRDDDPAHGFVSTRITSIGFWNDPAVQARRHRHIGANSVVMTGIGRWNGMAGYTFTLRATDGGEPGARRDRFQLTISDPNGTVVTTTSGAIRDGHIQSLPVHER